MVTGILAGIVRVVHLRDVTRKQSNGQFGLDGLVRIS